MLTDPQTIQIVQPIDVTQIAIALITTLGGALTFWLTGRRVGRGEARIEAAEKRVSDHAELARGYADRALQASLRPPLEPVIQSLPPDVLESDPPGSFDQVGSFAAPSMPRPPRPKPAPEIPGDRPTPKDRSVR